MESNKILNGVFWVYFERTLSQLISFVVTIVLARLLDPTHYGTIALLMVFIALADVFVSSSISSALIQKKDVDDLDYSSMFWFNFATSILLYIVLFFSAPSISSYFHNEQLSDVLRVLAIVLPLSAYNAIQQAYVSIRLAFKKTFLSHSLGGILSGVISIFWAYHGGGLWVLVAQRILDIGFNTVFLKMIVEWRPHFIFSFERLKPMLSFGWKMMVTSFLLTGYTQLRSLVIGRRYSAADLGYYDRGGAFPNLIAANIDSTITRVLFPALSQVQRDTLSLAEKSRRAAKTSSYIMTPILWGLAVIAHPLVEILLGEKWLPCVPYLQIMCFVWWLQPTQTCSAQGIKAIGRSDIYLYMEIISKIIGLILLAIAVIIFDSVYAIALMFLVGQVLAVFIYGICAQRYIGYKVSHQIQDLIIPGLLAMVMCVCIALLGGIISNVYLSISIQILCGIFIYIVLSHLTKIDVYLYLLKIVGIHNLIKK